MANPTETKKSGARFNVFDVIIILALLACIAAIVIRAYFTANIENDFTTAKIEFTVKEVSDYTAEALKENTTLYIAAGDDEIGTVDTVTYSPAELYAEDASGVLVPASHPDKKDVRGTATLYGIWTDDGFMINGTVSASVGKTVNVYTQDVACTLTITAAVRPES